MVSLSVSSVKNNMLAAYLDNKIFSTAPFITPLKNPQPRPSKALSCGFIYFNLVTPYLSECTLQNTVV